MCLAPWVLYLRAVFATWKGWNDFPCAFADEDGQKKLLVWVIVTINDFCIFGKGIQTVRKN